MSKINDKYQKYWNTPEIEKEKPFFITSKDDPKLLRHLREETNLERCFKDALSYSGNHFGGIAGQVLDVGAGVCWTSAIMAGMDSVKQVTALDYSGHRLNIIAPIVLEQYGVNPLSVKRIEGDFIEYPFAEASFDAIIFCQSLYMFPNLDITLKKALILLKPGGQLIVACERLEESPLELMKRKKVKQFLSIYKKSIMAKFGLTERELPRDKTGRSDYRDKHYSNSISHAGFSYHYQKLDYPLNPNNLVLAGNHFGLKARE